MDSKQPSSAARNFMTPDQCSEQFENYAATNPSRDSAHSLRFCANFLREFCVKAVDIERLARALAEQYSAGWKAHAEHIGEPPPVLTACEWSDANWQSFEKEARALLSPSPL